MSKEGSPMPDKVNPLHAAFLSITLGVALAFAPTAFAQTTASVTATCKDGSAYSGATRSGACRGHKGVDSWGAPSGASSAAAAPAPAAAPLAAATPVTPVAAKAASAPVAKPSSGAGQVWVNSTSKIYHCPGTRYYGKTKSGEYMSEVAAKAAGDHPSNGKACS